MVAVSEHTRATSTVGRAKLPSITSAVKMAPPRGTLYTAAKPAPPPQATSRRFWAGDRRNQCESTLPAAPPINLGAASRPTGAPMPMTTSDTTDVASDRRAPSSPSPFQMASSISERSWRR